MRSQRPIRVLLVDDHEIVRRGLAVFLDGFDDMELVGQAGDGEEALERCRELSPDVVLMDLVMPKMDGPTAIRKLQAQNPDVKVVALTTFRDKELVHETLQAGAVGYLYKDASVDELADAIRRAHAGNTVLLSPQAAEALLDLIENSDQPESTRGELTAPRAPGAGASGRGTDQPADRAPAACERVYGQAIRSRHPVQAAGEQPHRGSGDGSAAETAGRHLASRI